MAKVLQFALRASGERRVASNAPAEIVIFPGVRVEYHGDGPAPDDKRRQRRGRRRATKKTASA
jgi:hypothetical protein